MTFSLLLIQREIAVFSIQLMSHLLYHIFYVIILAVVIGIILIKHSFHMLLKYFFEH